jgi:hypothetical protein
MNSTNPSGTPVNPSVAPSKPKNSVGGLLSSICCCICSFICFILLVRGIMPRQTKTIIQPMPMAQPMVQ